MTVASFILDNIAYISIKLSLGAEFFFFLDISATSYKLANYDLTNFFLYRGNEGKMLCNAENCKFT